MAPTKRPRNGATKRRAISPDFKAKKTVVKKAKKPIFIPRDFLFDTIFPFLTNRQLYPLRFVNRVWKRLIETGVAKRQLPWRTVLHRITFTNYDNPYYGNGIDLGKTHPISREGEMATLNTSGDSYYYVYIAPQARDYDSERRLKLKLPKHPKTTGQLRFLRHWLRQLSHAHFTHCCTYDSFSPEFIAMVFPPDEEGHKEKFCLSFDTLYINRDQHKIFLQIARINRLLIDAYSVTEHIDFFIGCRYPIRNARIRQFYNVNGTVLFIINMAKRLQQLDACALLGQLPHTMDISSTAVNLWDYKWDMNGHGTSMAALTDDHPGLMRHVATRVDGKDDQTKLIEFLVKCADGTVDACIIVKVKYFGYMQAEYIIEILVKIEKL